MSTKTRKNTLFLIDVQNSFHVPNGSLAVPNSDVDAQRLIEFIKTNKKSIDRIVMTLDTHQKLDIAHPSFWINVKDGKSHPNPFTIIKTSDIGTIWKPRDDLNINDYAIDNDLFVDCIDDIKDSKTGKLNVINYCKEYTRLLEEQGKFMLCVWPEHCLIGSDGHNIVPDVLNALHDWEEQTGSYVKYVFKGMNILTESYSVFQAEVPVNKETSFNYDLLHYLLDSDMLWITGQASSHCVNYSVRDLVEKWPEKDRSKIHLISDCTSPVPSFEDAATKFVDDMKMSGIIITTSDTTY